MNSVKDVLEKYNYRIDKLTLNNNIRIIDSPSGKFVVKKRKNKDTRELFRYLNSRGFDNYLDYINDDQDDFMIFPYIDEVHDDRASRANDIILIDSLLLYLSIICNVLSLDPSSLMTSLIMTPSCRSMLSICS